MSNKPSPIKAYCNCLAQERGLAPQGHAGNFKDAVIVETPLPWKRGLMQEADPMPQQIIDLLKIWLEHYHETGEYNHRPLVVAPDPEYSCEGHRRVIFYTQPEGLFTQYEKCEFLVPENQLGGLVWAWYQERDALSNFDEYRIQKADAIRDILVCTHGTIDVACAKFGYPLYKFLRDKHANDTVRVWRVSHFGGHVFAPTFMDMPTGHYWAYLDNESAEKIIYREADVATLSNNYRGWAGVAYGFQQTAEYALWQEYGWDWFNMPRSAETLDQDSNEDNPEWADIRLRYISPEISQEKLFEARVEMSHTVSTISSTGYEKEYPYPQYRIVEAEIPSYD